MQQVARDDKMIILKKWLARSFFVLCVFLSLSQCNRFQKKEKKATPAFHVYVPLEEDYSLLKKGILSIIELSFPTSSIVVEEGLTDLYRLAPFEDWLTKAEVEGILSLTLRAERIEDVPHLLAFLNRDASKFPFKVKMATSNSLASEYRGEALFCRMQNSSRDILEQQLCKELVQKLCFKELRPLAKRFVAQIPPTCEMGLQVKALDPTKVSPKVFLYTGFPLPLMVNDDYPFKRFVEADEALLLTLFGPPKRD